MRKFFVVVGMMILASLLSGASELSDVIAPVQQFVDGFNQHDANKSIAACAEQASIIDDFAPFLWRGAGACSAWVDAYHAWAKQNAVTDATVTLGKLRYLEVVKDQAYVVFPVDFALTMKGKPMKEAAATFTVVLHKAASGWRISAWTWSHP